MESKASKPERDERLLEFGLLRRLLNRPELGAAGGAVAVWVLFALLAGDRGFVSLAGTASYLKVAADLGILAVGVALLMIGGEFDLSVGSIIGAAGMVMVIAAVHLGWPLGLAMAASLWVALLIGLFNGYLVVRTGLPSFIITLGSLFIVRGATIGFSKLIIQRTHLGGLGARPGYELASTLLVTEVPVGGAGFSVSILWWLGLAALATWVLNRTRFGNWIFAAGGAPASAHMVGVPVKGVKIVLFVITALCAWLVATIQVVSIGSADVLRGEQTEFIAIIAVVIGGTLLTGGYGSVVGAALGVLIFGMVNQGLVFAGADADWFKVFVGGMVVMAVLVNNYIRGKAAQGKP